MSIPAISAPLAATMRVTGLDVVVPAGLVAIAVGALAAAQGGYFPPSWGWSATALMWTVAVAVFVRSRFDWGAWDVVLVSAFAALTGWICLSLLWSEAAAPTVLEIQRALVYVGGVAAVLAVARRGSSSALLAGLLLAISVICTYALATRLFPDRLGVFDKVAVYRLSEPIGYWNGLGIFAAMGTVLAVGFAGRAKAVGARFLAGAALPVLLCTAYFTFGRGALLALPLGLLATVACDPRRLQALATMLVLAPPSAVAVWIASRADGLTREGVELATAVEDGRRVALAVVVLAVASGVLAVVFALVEARLTIRGTTRRVFGAVAVAAPVVLLAVVLVRIGGPVEAGERAVDAFRGPPPAAVDLNDRLRSFSANGRIEMWSVAWDEAKRNPVIGNGAGSYERAWLQTRPMDMQVRDAHGLYVELLAELGLVGLALLVVALLVPIIAAGRARANPLVPAALGAYVAYLIHAAGDWDWELSAVTLAALVAGSAVVVAARPTSRSNAPAPLIRISVMVAGLALGGVAVGGLVGNSALSASNDARTEGDLAAAQADARLAASWMPWSADPWLKLGELQLLAGDPAAARESLREGLSRDEGEWRLWYHLAVATNGDARRQALGAAERLNPRNSDVVALRAKVAER